MTIKILPTVCLSVTTAFVNVQAVEIEPSLFSYIEGKLSIPSIEVPGFGVYQAGLNRVEKQGFEFTVQQFNHLGQAGEAAANYDFTTQIAHLNDVVVTNSQGKAQNYQVTLQHIPNSEPFRLMVMAAHSHQGEQVYSKGLGTAQGSLRIADMETFNRLASLNDLPGVKGVQELKFLLTDIDSEYQVLYWQNSRDFPLHFDFSREVLGWYKGLSDNDAVAKFNTSTYFSDHRQHLAGSVTYYKDYLSTGGQSKGIFTLELWPTDPVSLTLINKAYKTIAATLPVSQAKLAYHPVSETHEQLYAEQHEDFSKANIATIFTEELFAQAESAVLNTGEAYGRLRVIGPGDTLPTEKDIVIFTYIPNSLTHVAGIITDTPQTPLSHINVKARQNNTPNAYIKSAATAPDIKALIGQWVYYQVSREGINIKAATQQQVEQWLASVRPAEQQNPESDLTVTELGKILAPGVAPDGYALPFAMYDEFMRQPRCGEDLRELCMNGESGNSLYDQAQVLIAGTGFQSDPEIRAVQLKAYRKTIEKAEVPEFLINRIEAIRYFWEPDGPPFLQSLRTRSSTNNEDLPGFNGAGLYKSYTHKDDEGELIKSVKQVWSSLWTDRAYDERSFHRINHFQTYMGVVVHPNYGDEQVNGVAVTKNVYNQHWPGFYVNAQYGEISITNPEPNMFNDVEVNPVPDEFMMTQLPSENAQLEWELQYIRHSNVETVYEQPVPTENVLTDSEIDELRVAVLTIQNHFQQLYQGNDDFALELEFKITETTDGSRGRLAIKQARPWID